MYYLDADHILYKRMQENDQVFKALVVPDSLMWQLLHQAHHVLGHNGAIRTYNYV